MDLAGKVAIVTGGGSGVGTAIAGQLAAAGAKIVIVGRRAEQLDAAREAIGAGEAVQARSADVADRAQVRALVEEVVAEHGGVDILVNNAGVNIPARQLAQLADEDWDQLLQVNTTGSFNMIQAVLPHMRAQKAGLIISISSISSLRASSLAGAAYSASKHALNALTFVVAQEEEQNGIRATVIAPGDINTPLLDKRPNPVSAEHRARILQPDDIAATVMFVAGLPDHVAIPEIVIKPVGQSFS